MKNKLGIAAIRELCPICTKETSQSLMMNKKLGKKQADEVEKLHDKNMWAKKICPDCQDMKEKGFILIGAVEAKTTDTTNPYRSGNIWVVKQEVAEELFAPHGAPKSGVAFVDVNVAAQMELPGVNLNA